MSSNFSNKLIIFIKTHKIISGFCVILIISVIYMGFTGTLSYPYILLDRQIELISDCAFGTNNFTTNVYGYSFSVPKKYCILPDRLFPVDGSIEIVPSGWYFVFNEYAKGTIAEGAKATLLFEPVVADRDPQLIIQSLIKGSFLNPNNISSIKNSSGIDFILADSVLGADNQLYNWAFSIRPDKKYFLAIITKHSDDQTVGKDLLENLKLIN